MLSKIEEQGKRRLEVMDMISTNIYDMLKTLRKEKDQQFKVVCVCNICTILCLFGFLLHCFLILLFLIYILVAALYLVFLFSNLLHHYASLLSILLHLLSL